MTGPTQTAQPHALKITGSLRHNLGFVHHADQQRQQAKSLWLNSVDLLERADGSELTRLAHFLSHLASVYADFDKATRALTL